MQIHDLIQGSPEWLAYRSEHFNASDAPAMLGVSPYKTRDQLLRETHTGIAEAVDAGQKKRFDNGHRLEALARPRAEEIVGEDLYPVTGSNGRLSASFDGLTLAETNGFEHKQLSAAIRAAFEQIDALGPCDDAEPGRLLPIYHRAQMEQQLYVSGAERILFMGSDWTAEGELMAERHCWYYPDAELRAQILRGWEQFAADLAAYKLPEAQPAAPVGRAPETLPALRIEITGQVTASNLPAFKATALAAIRSVNRDLQTDQDFADAEKAVKWCAEVEEKLAAAKQHALSQTTSIDELLRTMDDISAEARRVRLDLDKLVTSQKQQRKESEVAKARAALAAHVAELNAEIAPAALRPVAVDFGAAIKGLKTLDSVRSKLDAALAGAKIEASAEAQAIRANQATYHATAAEGFGFLFPDLAQLVHKAGDDFLALVQSRISAHRQAEAEKADRRRREEEARADQLRRQEEIARAAAQQAVTAAPAVVPPQQASVSSGHAIVSAIAAGIPVQHADEPATLKLGSICDALGIVMSAQFITETLRIPPRSTQGSAKLYRESDFERICFRLQEHVETVRLARREKAAA